MGERKGDHYSAPLKRVGYVRGRNRIRAPESVFLEVLRESGKKTSNEMVQNWNGTREGSEIKRIGQCRNVLVQAGSVGVFILLNNGDNKRDELGPKIQVFDAGSLFLWRHGSLLGLERKEKN